MSSLVGKMAKAGLKSGAKDVGKSAGRAIPGIGTVISLAFVYEDLKHHRLGSLAMDGLTAIPGLGMPLALADMATGASSKLDKAADKSGLTNKVYSAASRAVNPESIKADGKPFDATREKKAEKAKYETLDSSDKSGMNFKRNLAHEGVITAGTPKQQKEMAQGLVKLDNNKPLLLDHDELVRASQKNLEKGAELAR